MSNDLLKNLTSFIANFDMRVQEQNGDFTLEMPGYASMPWRAPIARKFLSRRNKNAVYYEESTTAAITFFFGALNVRTFFDAGAQNGYFSQLALLYKAHPIDVYAFEMQPHQHAILARVLSKTVQPGQHAEAVLAGLSDAHLGEHQIWYSITKMFETEPDEKDYRDPWYTRIKFALRGIHERDQPRQANVEITSLDHFAGAQGLNPDLIKIDVDGYEAKVIPGGMTVFKQAKPVIFLELHKKKFISRFGVTRRDIVRPLFEIGYDAYLLDDHHDRNKSITPLDLGDPRVDREQTDMLIFCHPDRRM